MIVEPHKQQEKYLEALEWLVSDRPNRGTGRTFSLACAFVNTSVKNPGCAITIFDHVPTLRCTIEIMAREVRSVAKRLYPLGNFTFTSRSVMFNNFKQ